MSETLFSPEELSTMIKGSCVENKGSMGYETKGDKELITAVARIGRSDAVKQIGETKYGDNAFTRIAVVPLSSGNIVSERLPKNYNKKDTALVFSYWGKDADSSHRDGVFTAIVVMSDTDSQKFIDQVTVAPELVFSLIRHVNIGPITRFDGAPLKINQGTAVEIVPNKTDGGRITEKITSTPFPENYQPNPLF